MGNGEWGMGNGDWEWVREEINKGFLADLRDYLLVFDNPLDADRPITSHQLPVTSPQEKVLDRGYLLFRREGKTRSGIKKIRNEGDDACCVKTQEYPNHPVLVPVRA